MAVKEAERISGGGFLNIRAAAGESVGDPGSLVWIRVVDWENEDYPPINEDYGWTMPFVYDAIVIPLDEDGEQDGEPQVWLRQDMRFGQNPMWVVRGHSRPDTKLKRRELPEPQNDVGDEVRGHLVLKQGKGKPYPVLNKATPKQKEILDRVREQLGGDNWGQGDDGDPF